MGVGGLPSSAAIPPMRLQPVGDRERMLRHLVGLEPSLLAIRNSSQVRPRFGSNGPARCGMFAACTAACTARLPRGCQQLVLTHAPGALHCMQATAYDFAKSKQPKAMLRVCRMGKGAGEGSRDSAVPCRHEARMCCGHWEPSAPSQLCASSPPPIYRSLRRSCGRPGQRWLRRWRRRCTRQRPPSTAPPPTSAPPR